MSNELDLDTPSFSLLYVAEVTIVGVGLFLMEFINEKCFVLHCFVFCFSKISIFGRFEVPREQNVRVPETCHKNHVKRGEYLKVASVVKNYDMNTF
jgi:hypothetical protein